MVYSIWKVRGQNLQQLGWIYFNGLNLLQDLSIPMPILWPNLITRLMFIHLPLSPYDLPGKNHNPTNHITDNNVYIFLHITGFEIGENVDLDVF